MANYVQTNNSVGSSYYNFFLSQVPYGEDYIIFRTDNYYICIYGDYQGNNTFKNSTVISISTQYNQNYTITRSNESNTTYSINYEYYTYSNIGTGTLLVSPQETINVTRHETLQTSLLFVLLLVVIGFNVIRKRWIDTQ